MRIGPTGEFHIKLAPTDDRIEELSARQACRSLAATGQCCLRTTCRIEERAGIGEDGAAQAEIVGHVRQREANFARYGPVRLATQRVLVI